MRCLCLLRLHSKLLIRQTSVSDVSVSLALQGHHQRSFVLSLLLGLCMAHVVNKRHISSLLYADWSVCALVQGTFLIRPSISLTGCMVVSTVAENGSVKHLCLDSKQLYSRALEVSLAAAVQVCHLHRWLWDGTGPGIDYCGIATAQG